MARKAGITPQQVVDAAVAIADAEGLEAVSLATVAAAIGVRAPSLYSHVDGVDGLRRHLARKAALLLADRMQAATQEETDGAAALRALAWAYRDFAREHPGLYASLLPVPRADDDPEGAAAAAEPLRVVAAVLADLGITANRQVDLIRTLRAVLHGFVDLELGRGFGLANPVDASFDIAVELVLGALTTERAQRGT